MKKILFLLIFTCCYVIGLSADDAPTKNRLILKEKSFFAKKIRPKIFAKDNCEFKMTWHPSIGLNFQLIYSGTFPKELRDYLNNPDPGKLFSAFYITFLDENGFELIKNMCYLNDFAIEGKGAGQKAVFRDHFKCDSKIYDRIDSIIIDYSQ